MDFIYDFSGKIEGFISQELSTLKTVAACDTAELRGPRMGATALWAGFRWFDFLLAIFVSGWPRERLHSHIQQPPIAQGIDINAYLTLMHLEGDPLAVVVVETNVRRWLPAD